MFFPDSRQNLPYVMRYSAHISRRLLMVLLLAGLNLLGYAAVSGARKHHALTAYSQARAPRLVRISGRVQDLLHGDGHELDPDSHARALRAERQRAATALHQSLLQPVVMAAVLTFPRPQPTTLSLPSESPLAYRLAPRAPGSTRGPPLA